ncbi:MAG: pyrimidine 5'-nucleotidase [Phenylobacterium sp.]|uniref:pyrimidine 5'-nucleotidase n=1 Tax=Phenylobacterium sp. TaxID=1871053 RepID=UPI0027359B04|nr:pyrimidine 5'-nucleotidase [Phenylobacterium sp.]MDP3748293.1 pyrimidine 5'-nucleotidase [Phenylobacterium sp.]
MTADLRHIDTWLFDLDNTLYPEESGFMGSVETRMTDFVAKVSGLPRDQAYVLQKKYLAEHGLTLKGLMLEHGVDPADFHALFHDLSLEVLAQDPDLLAALAHLPGRRFIFTNADDKHAERVMAHLGLADLFDDVFHIHSFGFAPKPDPQGFQRMIDAHGIDPKTTAFFEDSERNLKPAADLGMTTVLVGPRAAASTADYVHHRTAKLAPFLTGARLRKAA